MLPASDARGADLRGAQGEPGSIPRSSDGSGQTAPISMAAQRRRELKAMIRLMQDGSRDRVVQSGDLHQWKRNSINRADLFGDVGSFTNEQRKAIETFVELELALPRDWLGENAWGVGAVARHGSGSSAVVHQHAIFGPVDVVVLPAAQSPEKGKQTGGAGVPARTLMRSG